MTQAARCDIASFPAPVDPVALCTALSPAAPAPLPQAQAVQNLEALPKQDANGAEAGQEDSSLKHLSEFADAMGSDADVPSAKRAREDPLCSELGRASTQLRHGV